MSNYNNFTPSGQMDDDEDLGHQSVYSNMSKLALGARRSARKKGDWQLPSSSPGAQSARNWEIESSRLSELKEVGAGNFGKVFVGFCSDLRPGEAKTKVAVKTLLEESTKEIERDFMQEANIMKAIDGPHHIVRLLGVCTASKPYYMIMEFMPRGDLKGVLRASRPTAGKPSPLSLSILVSMASNIAEGMAYLASRKIVHRDLAARNCLVDDAYAVKVGDFGLTRDVYHREYYRMQGSAPLPIRWMSPENLCDGFFSSASDVWSFGVVMWEIITLGKIPYGDLSNMEVAEKVAEDAYRMPCPSCCPSEIYALMSKCWQEEAEDRPSFDSLYADLLALVPRLPTSPITRGSNPDSPQKEKSYALPQDALRNYQYTYQEDGSEEDEPAKEKEEEQPQESAIYDLGDTYAAPVVAPSKPALPVPAAESVKPKYGGATSWVTSNATKSAPKSGAAAPATPSAPAASLSQPSVSPAASSPATNSAASPSPQKSQEAALSANATSASAGLLAFSLANDQSEIANKARKANMELGEKAASDMLKWLESVYGSELPGNTLQTALKSGDVLCAVLNRIKPGSVKPHQNARLAFRQMENIGMFLSSCRTVGVADTDLFVTIDLFEGTNIKQVLNCLMALRSRAEALGFKI